MIVDDFLDPRLTSRLGTTWRVVTDTVMGGLSDASVRHTDVADRACLELTGTVRLDNGGGFVQAALDLGGSGGGFDASAFTGITLEVQGNGEHYNLHLRTPACVRPWQSYRSGFVGGAAWSRVCLPFDDFVAHRVDGTLDTTALRRLGVVAIGRAFQARVRLGLVAFYAAEVD